MIIILDGPDHSGKTTLAKEICRQDPAFTYLHLTYRWPGKMDLYHLAAIDHAIKSGGNYVIDRWWPSEEIYAHVHRGGTQWPYWGRMLNRILNSCGELVFCIPDRNWCLDGHGKRLDEEMYAVNDQVYDAYADVYFGNPLSDIKGYSGDLARMHGAKHLVNVSRYRAPDDDPKDMAEILLTRAYRRSLDHLPHFLGDPVRAKYLMVGEELNPKFRRHVYPFVDNGHSSKYLAMSCSKANVNEDDFCWTNAFIQGHLNRDIVAYEWNYELEVIPMGAVARQAMDKLQIPYDLVFHHPSYYRRFMNGTNKLMGILEALSCVTSTSDFDSMEPFVHQEAKS